MSDLSYVMLNLGEVFKDASLYQDVQRTIIKNSLVYHLSLNQAYNDYYKSFGLKDPRDGGFSISMIPLLPSSLFKRPGLRLTTLSDEQIIKYCASSGTRGSISNVPRDEDTLTNFLGSITSTMSCLFDVERPGNHKALVLGPPPEECGDLWFSYVLSTMALNFHTEYLEHDGVFKVADAVSVIQGAVERNAAVFIISPPFRIVELCSYLRELRRSIRLRENSYIVSAGGWKDRENQAVPRASFSKLVEQTFGVDGGFIRDSYNMVELNTVLNECEFHEKHVLPWLEVVARDPGTNEALGDGQLGILSFYDGSALSYPCFILSEDYGITSSGRCRCGRFGKRVSVVRRMEGVEARGCALKMAGFAEDAANSNVSNRFFKSFYRCPDLYLKERKSSDGSGA